MAKMPQVLEIDPPNEITFKGPFTEVVTTKLRLTNPSEKKVCFKVKTTAPKQYCVRPNSGFIPAKGNVEVSVMLQPMDVTSEGIGKHKFMVQTTYASDGDTSLENIWKNTAPNELMDSKLRVVFDGPEQPASMTESRTITNAAFQSVTDGGGEQQQARASTLQSDAANSKLKDRLQEYEDENVRLRAKLKQMESNPMGSGATSGPSSSKPSGGSLSDIKMLHVVIAAVIALFIGLLLGKVF